MSGPTSPAPASAAPTAPSAPPAAAPKASGSPTGRGAKASTPPRATKVETTVLSAEERTRLSVELLDRLKAQFPGEILDVSARPGVLARVKFPPEAVLRIMTWLRDQGSFTHCAMVAAVDWRETREVLYHLWSDSLRSYLELTTTVPGDDPHLESVSSLWFGANWHEREAWDLVGIRFDHHPDLRRLFLPEGYKFHPLLKSFELHEPEDLEVKARIGRLPDGTLAH